MAHDPILDADSEELVTWIRVYQRLLLEDVSSPEQLADLESWELRERTLGLECELYAMLERAALNEQDQERYESSLKGRRDILTALGEARDEGYKRGRAERIQNLQRFLGQENSPPDWWTTLSLSELEGLATQLEEQLDAKLGNGS
ncbi:MAG TPA: hypothetical protein VNH11_13375 [Pirellulales bacterium]|nr:hypothetical protein [Pirellulales bacterium]